MGSRVGQIAKKAMWLYPKVLGFSPPERWGHSACYSHGLVYVFGGCCGGLHFGDVLALNLNTMAWDTLATTGQGPGPRDSHSAVLVGKRMIVFGGTNGSKKVNDLHILDLESKEWMQPDCKGAAPSPRESHTATLVGKDKLVIFGGSGEGEANYLNDLHVLDLNTMNWTSPVVKGDIPVPRDSHSAVPISNKLFVYGGDCGDRYHGDVDMFDLDTLTWSRLAVQGHSPGVRAGHAAVNIGTKVYVIGGVGDRHYYNDVWILDVSTCSWTYLDIRGQQPQGRFSHAAVVTDSDVAIYGGCGEDERPLNELLILQLGADHPNGRYNISMCKNFGNHWNQEKRRFLRGVENNMKPMLWASNGRVSKGPPESELEPNQSFGVFSDSSHPKRRRSSNSKALEVESEQEEHSLSLSQNSSPSQSDQEQVTPVLKGTESVAGSQGFHLFKQLNQIPSSCQPNNAANNHKEAGDMVLRCSHDLQFLGEQRNHQKQERIHQTVHASRQGSQHQAAGHKTSETGPVQNLIGADVRGKVDGAFDSGFLMTATVNGKIFRGVLFPPGPGIISRAAMLPQTPFPTTSQIAIAQPFMSSNHIDVLKPSRQQMPVRLSVVDVGQSHRQAQINRGFPVIKATPTAAKEPKLRSDLSGVVLTLGGPGSGHI